MSENLKGYQELYDEFHEFTRVDKKRTRKRKRLLIIGLTLFTLVITIGSTFAMLNVLTNTKDNAFKFGQTKISVDEVWDPEFGWDKKEVRLTANAGDDYVPGVARAMLLPYIMDKDTGNYILSDLGTLSEPVDNKMVLGDIALEFADDWSTNWFYKEGYFYHKKVLNPGETTALLLKKVSLTSDTPAIREKYVAAQVKIEVMAGILQAEGGAPETEWGVTVNDKAVTP